MMRYLVYLLLLCSGLHCAAQGWKTERYLLPAGYKGVVLVIYDQPKGAPAAAHGDTVVYTIPGDGVLVTKAHGVDGATLFFRYAGANTDLPFAWDPRADHGDTVCVFSWSNGSFGNKGSKPLQFATFIVSTQKDADRLYQQTMDLNPAEVLEKERKRMGR